MFEKVYNVFSLTERDEMVERTNGLMLGHFFFKNVKKNYVFEDR